MLNTLINRLPDGCEELVTLLQRTLAEEQALSEPYRYGVALSAACALRNRDMSALIRLHTPPETLALVEKAVERLSITNPYYEARMVAEIGAGGSLQSLAMSPLDALELPDEIAYHYYALAVATIHGGKTCYRNHLMELLHNGQSAQAIDQALRLVAALHSVDRLMVMVD